MTLWLKLLGAKIIGISLNLPSRPSHFEKIKLSNENPIEINVNENNHPKPYITVRRNLKALISRSVYYEMIDDAQEVMIENKRCLALLSNNNYFKLYEL